MVLKKYAISAMTLAMIASGVAPSLANNELDEEVMEKSVKVAKPTINVTNKTIKVGDKFSPLANVTAKDTDGTNLTKHVIVTYNNVDTKKAGVYKVGYAVLGKKGQRTDVEIKVTVVGKETVISATDMTISIGTQGVDFKKGVTAIDVTGVDISQHIVIVENNVDTTKAGTYKVKYVVLDTKGNRVYHTRSVVVKEGTTIKAEDKVVNKGDKFNPLEGVTAVDITGQDLTRHIVITKNTVDTTKGGVGQVTYVVLDTQGNRITKTINVKVVGQTEILVGDMEISTGNHDFNPLNHVKAMDVSGLDITQYVIVVKNTVNTYKAGEYEVIFRVLDTEGVIVDKAVKVTVVGKDIATDEEVANALIEKIDNLGSDILYSQLSEIRAIRKEYDNASDAVKKLVTNIDKLVEAEEKLQVKIDKVKNVSNLINNIPSEITLDAEAQIKEVRNAYDALTEDEKAGILDIQLGVLVQAEETLNKLIAIRDNVNVQEAIKAIEEIPAVEDITLSDNAVIKRARAQYDALPEDLKFAVNISALEKAERKLHELMPQNVKDVLARLGFFPAMDEINVHYLEAIENLMTAYNALNEEEKALVGNEDKINALNLAGENIKKAKPIIEKIKALPEVNTVRIADKAKVEEVRTAYTQLPEDAVKYVDNYDKLVKLEEKIAQLETKVNEVKDMLTALPKPEQVTVEHIDAINAFSTAYNKLTPEQKKLVAPDEMVVIEYEFICDRLEKAQPVVEMIKALPEVNAVRIADKAKVQEARKAYDGAIVGSTNAGVANYINNYKKLQDLENKIAQLEAKVDEVKGMLTALPSPEDVTVDHVDEINAFSTAYNKLTPEQKKLVAPDEMVVIEYEFICDRIEKAQPVIGMIDALPEVNAVKIADRDRVNSARDAYSKLDKGADKYVTNYNKLVELERKLDELEAPAKEVKAMLEALPEPDQVTVEHVDAINAFSTAYNKLTPEQKKLVAPDEMVVMEYEFVCDRIEKAQPIIKMIDALPSVEEVKAEDEEKVNKVREAYTVATTGSLNAGVDKHVTNYSKLVELEAKIAELKRA